MFLKQFIFGKRQYTHLQSNKFYSFNKEISELNGRHFISKSSKILNLNPVLDTDGILRADSRISNFESDEISTKPIILDANSTVTFLLIKHFHEKYYHASHETVINELRQKYWIVGLRKGLRSLIAKCIVCKLQRARLFNPSMATLSKAGLAYRQRSFTHCGLDYFGPMGVKISWRR